MKNMGKCIVCGSEIPKDREKKDTCSSMCAMIKMAAWSQYLHKHKDELTRKAVEEYEKG